MNCQFISVSALRGSCKDASRMLSDVTGRRPRWQMATECLKRHSERGGNISHLNTWGWEPD